MRKRILLVDDEKDFVKLVKQRLQANGYKVLAAYNGDQGLKLAKKRPDLILLDIMMPTLSGIELCQLLKEDPGLKNIPVIFLTCKGTKEDERRGFAVGADEYVAKPFNPEELLDKINKVLEAKGK